MTTVLLNSAGMPEPSPETSRRLRAIHAGLFMRFLPHVTTHWAICLRWNENNPSWAQVQSGAMPEERAHDIIGYLPMDCSVDEAPAYLANMFREYPRDEVRNMAEAVLTHNMTAPVAQAAEQAMAEVMDMSDPSQTKSKRKRSK